MANSTVEVYEGAVYLDLSTDQLKKLGWLNGQRIEVSQMGDCITLRPRTIGDKTIIRSAMSHLGSEVGFNTAIDVPKPINGRYEVSAYRKHDRRFLGNLYFTEDGELIPEASTPDTVMRDLADALEVPALSQESEWTCLAACVRMCMAGCGLEQSEPFWIEKLGMSIRGGTLVQAQVALSEMGIECDLEHPPLAQLEHHLATFRPVIWGSESKLEVSPQANMRSSWWENLLANFSSTTQQQGAPMFGRKTICMLLWNSQVVRRW